MLPDTVSFDVLHALVVKGMAQSAPLAEITGRGTDEVLRELEALRTEGLATHMERRGLWRVTPKGRARHGELMDEDVPAHDRDLLRPGYEHFVPLNGRFKDTCTRWQVRDGVPNDHTDAAYDEALLKELEAQHEEAVAIIDRLAEVRSRFQRYGDALADALARLRNGEQKAFTGVMCDSYHDVWMELHRDLLVSMKIQREDEERAGTAR
ncbi:hypothetical protein [Streptomyces johnsoniae]|uniref:MarR family transcriptional regulator n=1 Tax=Streptomyces johnsoniae TaxID=3075532 RepID=A0ABU2S167_9ACTN|nr:hypothetical protein [Streptomyces sp. DSM 41886]MDT0442533.1 hypothetical protein [Streptomyces sp. DSM 41886]